MNNTALRQIPGHQECEMTRGRLEEGMLVEAKLRLEPFIIKPETVKSNIAYLEEIDYEF